MHDDTAGPGEEQQPGIRVALIGCTGVLGDVIRNAVRDEADLEVVLDTSPPSPAWDEWEATYVDGVDVVVWNNADTKRLETLLEASAHRQPPVLAAVDDGRGCELWQLVPHNTVLSALSPASLVHRIRSAAQPLTAKPHRGPTTTKENPR